MHKRNLCTCFSVFIFLWVVLPAAAGRVIYVDVDATGANDGSSWADAYNYLQDALADANSSAKPLEIRVARGILPRYPLWYRCLHVRRRLVSTAGYFYLRKLCLG